MSDDDTMSNNGTPRETSIGLVGWGRMGGPMGRRLLEAGYLVNVYDPSPRSQEDASASGGSLMESPRSVAEQSDIIITMLPDGPTARKAGTDATTGVLSGLRPGSLWIEMTSSDPDVTKELSELSADRSVDFVDAPVTGGVPKAVTGDLTVMAAGSKQALDRAQPILEDLSAQIFRVGETPGMGDVTKTVNNLLSAANLLIAAEGLALATEYGVDANDLLSVVNKGTGQSNATSWKIPQYVLPEKFDSGFTIGQYLKDLEIAMGVADLTTQPMKLSRVVVDAWRQLAESMSDSDHTEAVTAVLEDADRTVVGRETTAPEPGGNDE